MNDLLVYVIILTPILSGKHIHKSNLGRVILLMCISFMVYFMALMKTYCFAAACFFRTAKKGV